MRLLLLFALIVASMAESDWQPILPESSISFSSYKSPERSLHPSGQLKIVNRKPVHFAPSKYSGPPPTGDSCSVYKVSMNQEVFYQYVEYEKNIPDLKEFTLCMWTKFHNHSDDHPLFSYAVADRPKEISAWISNTEEASYFSMAIHGQTFFRLNYPLKLNTWYHSCQSWNGKTGEWQIWVNAERVGRGFHNRLVGHVIKGGGVAITGQEQSVLFSKDSIQQPLKRAPGLMGEVTMVQLYHVALTAGKAHKDHKHHHVHHFKHDGTPVDSATESATEAPAPPPTPLGNGNFLVGGQLQRPANLNLVPAPQPIIQLPNGLQLQQEYVNGQLGNRIISEQLLNSVHPDQFGGSVSIPQLSLSPSSGQTSYSSRPIGPSKATTVVLSGSLFNPANVQYIQDDMHNIYKRNSKRDKRDNPEKELTEQLRTGKKDKRGLVSLSDGSIVDEALLSPDLDDEKDEDAIFQESLLNGLAGVVGNLPVQNVQKETADEREPAEAEVKAVMQVCSGCAPEPFKRALVLSWRSTPKKLFSGAHYYKGLPLCRAF